MENVLCNLTKIVWIAIDFWIPGFYQITIEKSIKLARESIQHSYHSWSSLLTLRSNFWFRSLQIAPFDAQRTLPGRFWGTLRVLLGTLGHFWGILGVLLAVLGVVSGRSGMSLEMLLDALWHSCGKLWLLMLSWMPSGTTFARFLMLSGAPRRLKNHPPVQARA